MNILVIGGAGYIGSHMCRWLKKSGHNAVVYDNFSSGHPEAVKGFPVVNGCLGDRVTVKSAIEKHQIQAVMHFAAYIEVGESVINPSKYYKNNLCKVVDLLDQMIESGVKYFIFSSTAAVYGNPAGNSGLMETDRCMPINPYGRSKLMVEELLRDYEKAYGLKSTVFRYFNASGADDSVDIGESHNPETHLIPLVLKVASGERDSIKIFGTDYKTPDGTCIRDYIHVNDIAEAHLLGLIKMTEDNVSGTFNLGSGEGFSVKSIIDTAEAITGVQIKKIETGRRDGDPAILIADAAKAVKILDWKQKYNLHRIIETAWHWEKARKY